MTPVEVLRALQRVAPAGFALVGAWARNAWAPPRATTDLDLVVRCDAGTHASLCAALHDLGYAEVRRQRVDPDDELPDIAIYRNATAALRQVDLLVAKTEFEDQALGRAVDVDLGELSVRVVTAEDLLVYKLLADRPRDRDDVLAVARTQGRGARTLDWEHVRRWCEYWGIEERYEALRAALTSTRHD